MCDRHTHARTRTSGKPASCAHAPPQPPCTASHARACRTEHNTSTSNHTVSTRQRHTACTHMHADAWRTLLGQVSGHVLMWICSRLYSLVCLPVALRSLHSRLLLKLLLLSKLPTQGRHSVQQDTVSWSHSWSDRPGEHFRDARGARQQTQPGCCWAPAQAPHSRSHLLQLPLPLGCCPGLLMLHLLAPQLSSARLQHTKHVHGHVRHVLTAPP